MGKKSEPMPLYKKFYIALKTTDVALRAVDIPIKLATFLLIIACLIVLVAVLAMLYTSFFINLIAKLTIIVNDGADFVSIQMPGTVSNHSDSLTELENNGLILLNRTLEFLEIHNKNILDIENTTLTILREQNIKINQFGEQLNQTLIKLDSAVDALNQAAIKLNQVLDRIDRRLSQPPV